MLIILSVETINHSATHVAIYSSMWILSSSLLYENCGSFLSATLPMWIILTRCDSSDVDPFLYVDPPYGYSFIAVRFRHSRYCYSSYVDLLTHM